jgi:hypothetical protein
MISAQLIVSIRPRFVRFRLSPGLLALFLMVNPAHSLCHITRAMQLALVRQLTYALTTCLVERYLNTCRTRTLCGHVFGLYDIRSDS